jgi:hypothetical protein
VLLAPSTTASELVALWPHLGDDDPMPRVLDRLTVRGLAATPPFALVVPDSDGGTVRVVARGGVTVRVGDTAISGAGVSTWAERVVDAGASAITVVADSAASNADFELPVVDGIVAAAEVTSSPMAAPLAPLPVAPVGGGFILPSAPPAEQTMVPAEDTTAAPVTPARAMPPVDDTPSTAEPDGDHDGLTVASIDLRRLRAERAARGGGGEAAPVAGAAVAASAPVSTLRLPDGSVEPIGHEVVLGRAPSVSQVSGGRIPRLITIGAGDPDISRNHVRVAVEGDTVVVTDLHSRNGTHVVAPGKPPVKLRAGEPTPVLAGTVVDLGGGWTLQVVGA